MKSKTWDRGRAIDEVRADVWRYLTPAAQVEQTVLEAAALLQMRRSEVWALGRLHFLLSGEVNSLLDRLPWLVRRLSTTTTSEEEVSSERVRGPIEWGRTLGLRYSSGIANVYVTAPARRAFETPENQLLVFLLEQIVSLGRATGWCGDDGPGVGSRVSEQVARAERWLGSRMLAGLDRCAPTGRDLARVRSGRAARRYAAVLTAYDAYRGFVEQADRDAIRHAVEQVALAVCSDDTLFELQCTFKTLEGLRQLGWTLQPFGLFQGHLILVATRGDERITLSYQTTPDEFRRASIYRRIQEAHAIPVGSMRPDLVLRRQGPNVDQWLLVEIKRGLRPVEELARRAAADLLAYRSAFSGALSAQKLPYGLGVAWGSAVEPCESNGVLLATPDTLVSALSMAIAS